MSPPLCASGVLLSFHLFGEAERGRVEDLKKNSKAERESDHSDPWLPRRRGGGGEAEPGRVAQHPGDSRVARSDRARLSSSFPTASFSPLLSFLLEGVGIGKRDRERIFFFEASEPVNQLAAAHGFAVPKVHRQDQHLALLSGAPGGQSPPGWPGAGGGRGSEAPRAAGAGGGAPGAWRCGWPAPVPVPGSERL